MKKSNLLSLILAAGYPPINIGTVYGIVAVNNWFLLSPVYPLLFGVAAPLLVLAAFWTFITRIDKWRSSLILPVIATASMLLCGGLHFFIHRIACASI